MEKNTIDVDFGDGIFEIYIKLCGFFVGAHMVKQCIDGDTWFEFESVFTFKNQADKKVNEHFVSRLGLRLETYILDYMSTNH